MSVKVSVIVAMYNSGAYLDKCVTSFLEQTLNDCEIILVNDCSPDNSLELAQKYAEKYPDKVRVINHEKNMRAGAARNNGLKAAAGKYVWFVDADDWIAPTALEEAYMLAEKNSSDVVSVDYYEVISEDKEPLCLKEALPDSCTGAMDDQKRNDYIANCKAGFSKLMNREFLIRNELYYPEGIRYEDNGIVPLIGAMADRVDSIHKGLYYYRVDNPNSQTNTVQNEAVILDRLKAMDFFYGKAQSLGILPNLKEGVECFFVYIYYASNMLYYVRKNCVFSKDTFKLMKNITHERFPGFMDNGLLKRKLTSTNKMALRAGETSLWAVNVLRFLYPLYRRLAGVKGK